MGGSDPLTPSSGSDFSQTPWYLYGRAYPKFGFLVVPQSSLYFVFAEEVWIFFLSHFVPVVTECPTGKSHKRRLYAPTVTGSSCDSNLSPRL